MTQGAVAQHVRHLETHLGVTLFDRVPKGLALTPVGRGYHARIADAFADLRSATAQLKPEPDKVLISVTPTFAAKWLIPNLPDFAAKHPDVDLRIMATEKVSSFHSDGIDLAIRQGTPPFGAALQATLLFRQDVIAVAAPRLVETGQGPVNPDTLSRLPKIHDTHDLWPKFLAGIGVADQSKRGLRVTQTALAVDAAIAGQGVALVSRFLVSSDLAAGNLLEIGISNFTRTQEYYLLAERTARRRGSVDEVVSWVTARAEATK